jgi:hypothetical protein
MSKVLMMMIIVKVLWVFYFVAVLTRAILDADENLKKNKIEKFKIIF